MWVYDIWMWPFGLEPFWEQRGFGAKQKINNKEPNQPVSIIHIPLVPYVMTPKYTNTRAFVVFVFLSKRPRAVWSKPLAVLAYRKSNLTILCFDGLLAILLTVLPYHIHELHLHSFLISATEERLVLNNGTLLLRSKNDFGQNDNTKPFQWIERKNLSLGTIPTSKRNDFREVRIKEGSWKRQNGFLIIIQMARCTT